MCNNQELHGIQAEIESIVDDITNIDITDETVMERLLKVRQRIKCETSSGESQIVHAPTRRDRLRGYEHRLSTRWGSTDPYTISTSSRGSVFSECDICNNQRVGGSRYCRNHLDPAQGRGTFGQYEADYLGRIGVNPD